MVPYDFYAEQYCGEVIPPEEWEVYEKRAGEQLARYRRIYHVEEPEGNSTDMAICAMADAMHNFDLIANGQGGAMQSVSIGSVSASFANGTKVDISEKAQAKELYRCATMYLCIYRGVM